MITPNKFTPFDQSILKKLPILLDREKKDIEIKTLFKKTSSHFEDINQFLFAIDVLYILDRIDIDFETRTLKYVS